ncbi:MAG: hypothetical protein MUC62_04205 [Candidatus Thermoplasmatota archaeon]|nr:hypothetical protein [Candidatus Thermoplasmatota archaeon]
MNEAPDNVQEMLHRAEIALIQGNFIRAMGLSRTAGSMMDRTQELHRKFVKTLKQFAERVKYMEDWGYDVAEAQEILRRARDRATRSDYDSAITTISRVEDALKRATYLPFPLLNKVIDIHTSMTFKDGKINYFVRVENPSDEPLGELIIRPFIKDGDFKENVEKNFGNVGARWWAEWTFLLTPVKKDWNLGVGREVLMEEGVIMKTRLSSRKGTASYSITIENNSDQIMRDVVLVPMIPQGLEAEPPEGLLDHVPPYGQRSCEFSLKPTGLAGKDAVPKKIEKVIVLEEPPEEVSPPDGTKNQEDGGGDQRGGDEEELEWNVEERSVDRSAPTDFTPVEEEYDLVDRSPFKFPSEVEEELSRRKRAKG